MLPTIDVEVDGHTATVDAADWGADPETVRADVRAARAAASDLTGVHEPADWDYDSLAAAFGADDTTEVDS